MVPLTHFFFNCPYTLVMEVCSVGANRYNSRYPLKPINTLSHISEPYGLEKAHPLFGMTGESIEITKKNIALSNVVLFGYRPGRPRGGVGEGRDVGVVLPHSPGNGEDHVVLGHHLVPAIVENAGRGFTVLS